jgi:hypothetical protein
MRLFRLLIGRVALGAALTLPLGFVTSHAATSAPPGESHRATSGYSAAALFNQANTDARKGKTGPAILNYERALLLAPADADIAANLHFVRAKAGLPDASENGFARSLTYTRPNTLAWLGSCGLMLAGLSVLLGHVYPQRRRAFRALTFAGALLVANAVASAITLWPSVNEAVVIVRAAPARTSPVLAVEPAFQLREGETVTVRAEHGDFMLVQTPAGRSGWVAGAELARVVPQSLSAKAR